MNDRFIVTIDGPAASGKSTLAKLLSKRDGFLHIDTGALYRTIGFVLGLNPTKEQLDKLNITVEKKDRIVIKYKGKDVETFIRTEECGMLASNVAKLEFVRDFVNNFARKLATKGRYVIDGRDCGSVIFPNADLKIFLVAGIKERAARRAKEDGKSVLKIEKDIENRDKQDKNRKVAPLLQPKGAVKIDTTDMSIEEMYLKVKRLIEDKI